MDSWLCNVWHKLDSQSRGAGLEILNPLDRRTLATILPTWPGRRQHRTRQRLTKCAPLTRAPYAARDPMQQDHRSCIRTHGHAPRICLRSGSATFAG